MDAYSLMFAEALISPSFSPDLGANASDLHFLVGKWHAVVRDYLDDGTYEENHGEWWFSWVLEGRALQDIWIVPTRNERISVRTDFNRYGTTLRFFDRQNGLWRITWINPVTGARNELAGKRVDDQIVLEGQMGDEPIRWSFSDIRADSFIWRGEHQTMDGNWIVGAEFFLTRAPLGEDAGRKFQRPLFDHLDVRVRDLTMARSFYDPVCGALGLTSIIESPHWVVYETPERDWSFLALNAASDFQPSLTRVAFHVGSRADVDRVSRLAETFGARDFEPAHECPEYSEGYYASFFSDPDGNPYEICYRLSIE